jgi:uncharacterized OB-fold protein
MGTWVKPLPNVSPETKPFWDACKDGRLIIQRCNDCGKFQTYYRAFCCHCWSSTMTDVTANGTGTIWGTTVTYRNSTPAWAESVPYVMAIVELAEGPKVVTNVINCDPEAVEVGMPVKVTFVAVTEDITLPYFELAEPG